MANELSHLWFFHFVMVDGSILDSNLVCAVVPASSSFCFCWTVSAFLCSFSMRFCSFASLRLAKYRRYFRRADFVGNVVRCFQSSHWMVAGSGQYLPIAYAYSVWTIQSAIGIYDLNVFDLWLIAMFTSVSTSFRRLSSFAFGLSESSGSLLSLWKRFCVKNGVDRRTIRFLLKPMPISLCVKCSANFSISSSISVRVNSFVG